jgi:hypothetical protein
VEARTCGAAALRRAIGRGAGVGGALGDVEVVASGDGTAVDGGTTDGADEVGDSGARFEKWTCAGAGVALFLAGEVRRYIPAIAIVTIRRTRLTAVRSVCR